MTRPERSRQERRIARGREADEAFNRIMSESIAKAKALAEFEAWHDAARFTGDVHDEDDDPFGLRA